MASFVARKSISSTPVASNADCFLKNATFFSTAEFVHAVCNSVGSDFRPLGVPVAESGPPRRMYGIQSPARYWSRFVFLAPYHLHASPGWNGSLDRVTLE